MKEAIKKAKVLMEALPYIKSFYDKIVVIKYGGSAMIDEDLKRSVIQDIIFMEYVGMHPIVIHGGGAQISELMKKLGKKPKFIKGMRVTDKETAEIVEMVLDGKINSEIVQLINKNGGNAAGLSGKDGNLIRAKKLLGEKGEDMGYVGEVESINPGIIDVLGKQDFIPVISPIGAGKDGHTYNMNADLVAGELASALKAHKLVLLTDVKGIYKGKTLLPTLKIKDAKKLIEKGVIGAGMIPKVKACITALKAGVAKTHIIDGRIPHSLLLEIYTDKGIGTEIVR
ncbi:acetylglutamate kinase [bacterium]|nr:acetylglutamate kinase [bacterium]MBU4561020.1 acetylglutamate kinase [bacterium]MCG2675866.1 acetylglutamate kinase [bacterium]MCG2677522.1 acetylglutamate kinase [bacterium]